MQTNQTPGEREVEKLEFRPDDKGEFDEIVARFADGSVHVETLNNQACYVGFYWDDGRYCQWWIGCTGRGKLTYNHDDGEGDPPKFPTGYATPQPTRDEEVEAVARAIDEALPESDKLTLAPSQIRRAARAALAAMQHPMKKECRGWLPIESAPKDGTSILITGGTRDYPDSMSGPDPFRSVVAIGRWDRSWKQWEGESISHDDCYSHNPTHWQPLPEPPAMTAARVEGE